MCKEQRLFRMEFQGDAPTRLAITRLLDKFEEEQTVKDGFNMCSQYFSILIYEAFL